MIAAVGCSCGSTDKVIRGKLEKYGYRGFLEIQVHKGKEKSLRKIDSLPQFEEIKILREYVKKASKYAIIIGYDEEDARWVDLVNGKRVVNDVEAELLINRFA